MTVYVEKELDNQTQGKKGERNKRKEILQGGKKKKKEENV